ncbi:hypothetical protein [Pseudomonas synxantha]|uniref:Uncharacterized protein n=1 Tax=Pseudomonas synxantha TaxID=47883 RepID=A0A5D3GDK0_9PSED|nr:hypothetical protein [Pseudomonas synxantha]TYK58649.1 hypothetical protein FXO26_07595 [Pseudomonas synxantha]
MPKLLLDLPEPTLVEADENGRVDSLTLLDGGNVSVCYDDMQATDSITLNWPLAGSAYPPIPPQNGNDAGCINIYIPAEYIALWLDNYVLFTYTVTRNGDDQTSLQGQVWISLPSNLPQVQILKATDGKLDLSLLCCKDPILYIPSWAFADTIQTIDCYIGGIYPDGSKARLYPFEDEPVTDEDIRLGWRRAIPRELFQQLKHDSELFVLASVRFSRATPYRSFPSLVLTLLTEPHLELSPPDLKEAAHTEFDGWVVNPINTVNGAHITVGYEGICSGDTVCPKSSGTPGPGTPVLECRQPVEGETSLVFAVSPLAIRANFEQTITLTYGVTRCDGSQWSSPERRVKVLGITGLPKSNIEQSTGNRLDLNTFRGDAKGVVPIWSYAIELDCCWMWVTGTLEDGSDYCFYVLEAEPLKAAWLHDGVDTPISRAKLQKLADCKAFELHFAANFDGQCTWETAVEFPVRTFSIEQEALTLPPPRVCEAVDDQLTIWNGRDGVTVRVEYERISPHQTIQVKWIKADGTSLPLESKPGNSDPGYVDFAIPSEAVIQGAGKTILINYIVTSTCKLAPSKTLGLKISVPTRLPTPVVPEATPPATQGGILDLQTFTGDAHITVYDANFDKAWWFAFEGQNAWLRVVGTLESGAPHTINVRMDPRVISEEVDNGLSAVLLRSELEKLKDHSPLTVFCEVTTDGSSSATGAVRFPSLELTVIVPPKIRYENFTGQPTRLISAGASISIPTMNIRFLSGPGKMGISTYPSTPGMLEGQALVFADGLGQAPSHQRVRLDLTFTCKRVKCAYTWNHYPTTVSFYSPSGGYLGAVNLNGSPLNSWIDFSAPVGSVIGYIEISSGDWMYFDFFTFWL